VKKIKNFVPNEKEIESKEFSRKKQCPIILKGKI
jgi:hypothetical protein